MKSRNLVLRALWGLVELLSYPFKDHPRKEWAKRMMREDAETFLEMEKEAAAIAEERRREARL